MLQSSPIRLASPKSVIYGSSWAVDEDVRRLDIPVEDHPLMGVVHRAGDLGDQARRGSRIVLEARNMLGQVTALDQLHAEVGLIVLLVDLIDRNDMRVVEIGDRSGLAPESVEKVVARQRARPDHLDGHQAIELFLTHPIHDPHAAASDFLEQLVLTQVTRCSTGETRRCRFGLGQRDQGAACGRIRRRYSPDPCRGEHVPEEASSVGAGIAASGAAKPDGSAPSP